MIYFLWSQCKFTYVYLHFYVCFYLFTFVFMKFLRQTRMWYRTDVSIHSFWMWYGGLYYILLGCITFCSGQLNDKVTYIYYMYMNLCYAITKFLSPNLPVMWRITPTKSSNRHQNKHVQTSLAQTSNTDIVGPCSSSAHLFYLPPVIMYIGL